MKLFKAISNFMSAVDSMTAAIFHFTGMAFLVTTRITIMYFVYHVAKNFM